MSPIPPDIHLQVTLLISIIGTFAKTNFFGWIAPFLYPKLVAGVRPWDYQNGLYYQ